MISKKSLTEGYIGNKCIANEVCIPPIADEYAALLYETDKQPELLKQFRQQILQDAIEGKLTADWRKKNPALITGENHAAKLIEKIKSEKSRLIQQGKLKKEKPLPPITEAEKPFPLPEGWAWCRLGEISELITSGSRDWAKYYNNDGRAKFVRMGDLSHDGYLLKQENIQYVDPPKTGEGTRTGLIKEDILVSITGDVRWMGLVQDGFGEAYVNQLLSRPFAKT